MAASSLQARFAAFDEDGNKLWEPDGEADIIVSWLINSTVCAAANISDPMSDCSTLELISPDLWVTMDG